MVLGIFKKENVTFIKTTDVDFTSAEGKRITGKNLIFEDSNEIEGSFFVNEEEWNEIKENIPTKKTEGTLYIKVSEKFKKPKISFKKFEAKE